MSRVASFCREHVFGRALAGLAAQTAQTAADSAEPRQEAKLEASFCPRFSFVVRCLPSFVLFSLNQPKGQSSGSTTEESITRSCILVANICTVLTCQTAACGCKRALIRTRPQAAVEVDALASVAGRYDTTRYVHTMLLVTLHCTA